MAGRRDTMYSVIPPPPRPQVSCHHGLSLRTSPNHVKHCHTATRADAIILETYLDYRAGRLTQEDYEVLCAVPINVRLAEACDYKELSTTRSGSTSTSSNDDDDNDNDRPMPPLKRYEAARRANVVPLTLAARGLHLERDNDGDDNEGEEGERNWDVDDLVNGLRPCAWTARDSLDCPRYLVDEREVRSKVKSPKPRAWFAKCWAMLKMRGERLWCDYEDED